MSDVPLEGLLLCLLRSCEKAARIARTFREQCDDLFGLLVEEKSEIRKDRRVVQDFKTLADVLVQETIKRDVAKEFPALSSRIRGEEQNSFQNTLGESISVELTDHPDETTRLLCKVLDGRVQVAEALSSTVYHSIGDAEIRCCNNFSSSSVVPADRLGVWIDPIDSTAEYIRAKQSSVDEHDIRLCGLECVCVLIGAYDLETGLPLVGIVNQPFCNRQVGDPSKWESNMCWGISHESVTATSLPPRKEDLRDRKKVVVTSCFEKQPLQSVLKTKYAVVHAAGAGYKCLVVANSKADLYVLSLQNTHFWDTCGPHAILAAQGGGIVDFDRTVNSGEAVDHSNIRDYQLRYLADSTNPTFQNRGGIIAYRNLDDLLEFLDLLRECEYKAEPVMK